MTGGPTSARHAIGPDAIACTPWGVSGRDNLADIARGVDLAIEAITGGTRLIVEVQLVMPTAELRQEIGDHVRRIGDLALETDVARLSFFCDGGCNGFIVDIEPDIGVKLHDRPAPGA